MEKKNLNTFVLAAALLMALTFLAHLFAGSPELYVPLRASELSDIEKSSFSVVWHFVSVHLFLSTIALFYLAWNRNSALFTFTLANALGFGLLFISYGLFDLHSLWVMPQWIAFILVSGFMLLSIKRGHR